MSAPYRYDSKAPIYFKPPIHRISLEEFKTSVEIVPVWRGFTICAFAALLILSGLMIANFQVHNYWPVGPVVVLIAFLFWADDKGNFHRNIVLEYHRQSQ